jgi:hypothetical protein
LTSVRGRRNRELLFNGYRVSVWIDEEILEMNSVIGGTTM